MCGKLSSIRNNHRRTIMDDVTFTPLDMQGSGSWLKRLSLRHLQLLISLAELGSLSDTARATATTQPALSKWLKEMEDSIGAPLFERLPRGLRPTHHGNVLLSHARRVLNEMGRAQSNLAALRGTGTERVILGTTPPSAAAIVPQAIAEFLRLHPNAKVDVWESSMSVLLEKLGQGAIDIVLGGLDDYQPDADIQSELLYPESTRIIARSKHPLARKRKAVTWDDLHAYDWIVWPLGTPVRSKLDLALSRAGRAPLPYRIESSSLTANLALIESSDMLGAVSGRLSRYFAQHGAIASLEFSLDADSSVGMYWRSREHQTAETRDMIASLRKVVKATG
jgi:DNA-binding transcriptional LysR family regulator